MLAKIRRWLKLTSELGQLYLMSRRPHIEEQLPFDIGPGSWVVFATRGPMQGGDPIYGSPSYRAVEAGERFWIFVAEGEYWLYAVGGEEPQAALKQFYAAPEDAKLLDSPVVSEPGFRTDVSRLE